MKTGRFKTFGKRVLAIVLCVCMLSTLLCEAAFASSGGTETNFIVRHWHANGDYEEVTGYINSGGNVYVLNSKTGKYEEPVAGPYTVTPNPWDYNSVDALGGSTVISERFTSFSVAAGAGAVRISGESATIEYDPHIPTVKVHVFYSLDGNTRGYSFGEAGLSGDSEKDVVTVTADNMSKFTDLTDLKEGERIYDTSAGLHTDKTASLATAPGLDDGRTFNLTLESWYAGENLADVGLILDSSGSMAFLTEGLDDKELHKYTISTSDKRFDDAQPNEDQFLTKEQVEAILDSNLTDNSPLSYSDYTYYIFDDRDTTKEFVPLGYWDGDMVSEGRESSLTKGLVGYYPLDNSLKNAALDSGEATGDPAYSSSGSQGQALDLSSKPGKSVTLDVGLPEGDYTISFAVKTGDSGWGNNKLTDGAFEDIMQIGGSYFIHRRAGSSSTRLTWSVGSNENGTQVSSLNHLFNNNSNYWNNKNWRVITYVVSNGGTTVTAYVNGVKATTDGDHAQETASSHTISSLVSAGSAIVLGGSSSYSTAGLYVDEVYIYDRALSDDEVKTLNTVSTTNATVNDRVMPKNLVAHFKNGTDMQLGDSKIAETLTTDADRAGWYYVNSSDDHDNLSDVGSAKSLRSLQKPNSKNKPSPDNGQYPTTPTELKDEEGNKIAGESVSGSTLSKFYISSADGCLHCIFNSSSQNVRDSVVWIKDSGTRTKAEQLQHALGTFVNRLDMSSPNSRVSAVRFSTKKFEGYEDELLMQGWTSEPSVSTGIMGLQRGDDSADGVKSWDNDGGLYNYVMTGGTYAYMGLKAFNTYLAGDTQPGAKKYVILFTDGKDDELTKDLEITEQQYLDNPTEIQGKIATTEAVKAADELKKAGYTIYCVMLASRNSATNETVVQEFLGQIASGSVEDGYVHIAKSSSELDDAFDTILGQISFDLDGYTVQDYIDPRFDLIASPTIDAEGGTTPTTIHLHAGGKIEIEGETGETDITGSGQDLYFINGSTGSSMATLYYDSVNDLYYLQWKDQTIPGCNVNAHQLNVWRSTITVKAKEDFIGGNAVLSNGNAANQNYVFDPDSPGSSGTDNANPGGGTPPVQGLPQDHGGREPAAPEPGNGADHLFGRGNRPGRYRRTAGQQAGQ